MLNYGAYHHNGAGIMTYLARGSVIEHNEIYNCGSGIFIKGYENEDNTIRYNYVYGTAGQGKGILIGTSSGSNNMIYQNIVRDIRIGISMHPMVDNALRGAYYIVNNTLVNVGSSSEDGPIWFNYRIGSPATFVIQNNIITHNTSRTGIQAYCWDNAGSISGDYNNYYNVNAWYLNTSTYANIANWRSALGGCPAAGNDCNSLTSNPMFVNAGAGDYKLQTSSPARTLGRDILNLSGAGSSAIIPAGAYITGSEVIGRSSSLPAPSPSPLPAPVGSISPPTGLRIQ